MGWDVQGYYKNPGEKHSQWHVECSGDSIDEIEEYYGYNPLSIQEENFGELFYGNSQLEIFRGYSIIKDQIQTKHILYQFTGLPVYAHKWNPQAKRFNSFTMTFLELECVWLFYDALETNGKVIKNALSDLKSRLKDKGLISLVDIIIIDQEIEQN